MRILVDRISEGTMRYIKAAGKSTEAPPTKNICSGSMYVQVDAGKIQMFDEIDSEWHDFAKFDTGASAASLGGTLGGGFSGNPGSDEPDEPETPVEGEE